MSGVSDKPWSGFSQADYSPAQWKAACLIDRGSGDPQSKDRYALPVREPDGTLNRNAVHAAAGRIGQVQGVGADQHAAAARKLVSLYENELNEEPPASLEKLSGESEAADQREDAMMGQRAAVEARAANVDRVDFAERIITVIAVPYEQSTQVEYRGETWNEVFSRSAFNGLETRQRSIPVSAVLRAPSFDHAGGHLVGKVKEAFPGHAEGLLLNTRISKTPAGDEMLQLTADGALSPSVGFMTRGSDHQLDRRAMTRRINRAFLDHLSFVPQPAYAGAKVLGIRDAGPAVLARELPQLVTPSLDEYFADPLTAWANERLNRA